MGSAFYYNPGKMLSYNRILNCVIGARGIGKSYSMKEHVIKQFLKPDPNKKGEILEQQFIYLRRYKPELKKIKTYFNDVKDAFPGHTFQVKGREFHIDGKLAGYAIPLSAWQSEKSNAYPEVTTIIFDEFIREKDNSGYLPNEVNALLNLMDTVFRDRENVRCVCLSNAVSVVNPYFLYFGLVPNIDKRFNAYKDILIEIPDSHDFSNERRQTRFGRLIDGTDYGDMSLDNEFVNDSSIFIEKRAKDSKFVFAVVYNGMTMGIWVTERTMYLCTEFDPTSKKIFALSTDDLDENTIMMTKWKNNYYLKKLVSAFLNGQLRFDNQVMRNVGYELFKKMNIQ